jgi:ACT domain-containing protein
MPRAGLGEPVERDEAVRRMEGGSVLIGKINDKSRQKILVTIRQVKAARLIDLRVHQTNDDGELVATPAGVSLTVDQVDQAIELLKEAKKKATPEEQG